MPQTSNNNSVTKIQKIKTKNFFGFTLVELIVVIVILAILATIAFLSFNSYSASSRDSVRLSDINSLKKSLEMYNINGGAGYPIPDSYTGVTFSGGILWYQGTIGDQVARIMSSNISKKPLDPLFNLEYTYSLLGNKREYQIKANLESGKIGYNNPPDSLSFVFPLIKGDMRGINSANAASTGATTCYINGNFNGLLDFTKDSGNTNYILAVPSLILTNPNNANNTTFTGGNLSRMGSGILQCNGQNDPCVVNYNSSNVIYTGIPTTTAQITTLTQNLQQAYSGSNITTIPAITNLLTATGQSLIDIGAGVVKNSVAATTLTQPDINTPILFHFDGDFNNYGTNTSTISNSGGVSFTGGKLGQAVYFNGSNHLILPDSNDYNFGTGNFTMDLWVYKNGSWTAGPAALDTFIGHGTQLGGNGQFQFSASDTSITIYVSVNGNTWFNTTSCAYAWTNNQWYHIAAVRNGATITIYVNGIAQSPTINIGTNALFDSSDQLIIGARNPFDQHITGNIDELRITKGLARRTSNFTPPSSPY